MPIEFAAVKGAELVMQSFWFAQTGPLILRRHDAANPLTPQTVFATIRLLSNQG